MKRRISLILFLVFCLWAFAAAGQIYEWIDKDGVKHFTNEPPPPGAKIVNAEKAIPYNEAADQTRTQEGQEALNQDMEQQETQTNPQAESQPETEEVQAESSGIQNESSDSEDDNDVDGVIVDPYVRDRERVRQIERRKPEDEEILPPDRVRDRRRGGIRRR